MKTSNIAGVDLLNLMYVGDSVRRWCEDINISVLDQTADSLLIGGGGGEGCEEN
jgi:hypothetical protein